MNSTEYHIRKMDCPSEEALIRMKLDALTGIHHLAFDLQSRTLVVAHDGEPLAITSALEELSLGTEWRSTTPIEGNSIETEDPRIQRKVLWWALGINAAFFVGETTGGLIFGSLGLVADGLDMLADALVYSVALWAIGRTVRAKGRAARLAGVLQALLAVAGLAEVVRRFLSSAALPDYLGMIGISAMAMAANVVTLIILQRARSREVHIRASLIFTANDILINAGVILAGLLVMWLKHPLPDLIIGCLVFLIVMRGALRILSLKAGRS
ncbi:MAG TPA: cation transporter [Bacteroidales bacterium]|nr:cation transporter [Bacteroidales bacterium]HRZ76658.1 cation transporter [Bacteroidales bacterium]